MAARRQQDQRFPERDERRFDVLSVDGDVAMTRERQRTPLPRGGNGAVETLRPGPTVYEIDADRFFLSEQAADGTYTVNLTEQGMVAFETALGIANDFGSNTRISPYSTIADLMERTAIRERLAAELRRGRRELLHRLRTALLKRQLRGTEKPSRRQRGISHIGKVVIVLLFVYWTIQQLLTAAADITAIPGILSNIVGNLLQPGAASDSVGARISDAYYHFVLAVVGAHLVYIVARLMHPLGRIYRKDQLVPGERPTLRAADWVLRQIQSREQGTSWDDQRSRVIS